MRSIIYATVWEYARRARFTFAAILAAGLGLPALVYGLEPNASFQVNDALAGMVECTFYLFCLVAFNLAVLSLQGSRPGTTFGGGLNPFYTLPLSSWRLAAPQMLCGMAMIALMYSLTALVLNFWFGVGWKVAGPAMLSAVTYACLQAAAWSTLRLGLLQVVICLLVSTPLVFWVKMHFGSLLGPPSHRFHPIQPLEACAMLVVSLLATMIATVSIGRDRRGEMQGWIAARAWWRRVADRLPGRGVRFGSPARAQIWYEWCEKGWMVPFSFLLTMTVLLLCLAFFNVSFREAWQELPPVGVAAVMAASIAAAVFMGHGDLPRGRMECTTFLGTRPMTDRQLAAATLKTTLLGVASAWLLWLIVAMVVGATLWLWDGSGQSRGEVAGPWLRKQYVIGLVVMLLSWVIPAVFVPAGLTGRKGLLMLLLCCLPASIVAWTFAVDWLLPESIAAIVRSVFVYVLAAMMIGGTIAAFIIAANARKCLLPPSRAALVWMALCGFMATCFIATGEVQWPAAVLLAGGCAIAISPLATAPLAVSWNRHR